jgi:hypothetical protein
MSLLLFLLLLLLHSEDDFLLHHLLDMSNLVVHSHSQEIKTHLGLGDCMVEYVVRSDNVGLYPNHAWSKYMRMGSIGV